MTRSLPLACCCGLVGLGLILAAAGGQPSPLESAEAAYDAGDYARAFDLATTVVSEEPASARAHFIAGASGLEVADVAPKRAERHLKKALELDPSTPFAHYLLGYVAYERAFEFGTRFKRRSDTLLLQAAAHFDAELERSPGMVRATAARAFALARAERVDQAVAAHEAWIEVAPHDKEPYESLARLYVRAGRAVEGLSVLDRIPPEADRLALDVTFGLSLELYRHEQPGLAGRLLETIRQRDEASWRHYGLQVVDHLNHERLELVKDELELFLNANPPGYSVQSITEFLRTLSIAEIVEIAGRRHPDQQHELPESVTDPERVKHVLPRYPESAKRHRARGSVFMLVVVRTDGIPSVLTTWTTPLQHDFEASAIAAVQQWRYRPAMRNGEPWATVLVVTVTYDV